jgi:hypothetical protein
MLSIVATVCSLDCLICFLGCIGEVGFERVLLFVCALFHRTPNLLEIKVDFSKHK